MPKVVVVYVVLALVGILAIAAADSDTDFPDSVQNRNVDTNRTRRIQETTTKEIDEKDEADKVEAEVTTNIDDSSISISTTEPPSSTKRPFSSTTKSPRRGKQSGRLLNGGGDKKRNNNGNSRNKNNRNSTVSEPYKEPKAVFAEDNENSEKDENISNDPENNFDTDDDTEFSTGKSGSNNDEPIINGNEVVCSSPPDIEGSISPVLHGTEHPEGTTIWYQCPLGHVSRSSSSLLSTCKLNTATGQGEWTHPDISCVPRSCGDPGYVPNGRRIGNLLTFPNKIEFECQEGFKLRGIKSRYCQAGGEWSGRLPTCETIYCTVPSDPVHGRVLFSSLEYGSELEYKCNEGYMLRNYQTRYCNEDGKWSGIDPECVEIACEMPEKPLHGLVHVSGDLKPGSLALFSCDQGTTLFGTSRNKCQPSGKWTFDPPKCFHFCKAPSIQNGELGSFEEVRLNRQRNYLRFVKINRDEQVEHNKTIVLRCREGFLPGNHTTDETDKVTCIDGRWSKPMQCQKFYCLGDPPPVEHATTMVNRREHKATVWYKCDDGYERVKSGNVTCRYGNWDGTTPVCADFRCHLDKLNYPGLVKPAEEFLYDKHGLDVRCEKGYRLNPWKKRILCSRGQWKIDSNPCSIIEECEDDPPTPFKGKPKQFTRHHGSLVDYECEEDYEIAGQSSVHCERGKWTGQTPACIRPVQHLQRNNGSAATHFTSENTREPLSGTPSSEVLDDCFCTYHYRKDLLHAFVEDKPLKDGNTVKKGEAISFICQDSAKDIVWPNGFRMQHSLYLNCTTCQEWHMHDLPYCDFRRPGDAFIIYNRSMKFLPGGIIEVEKLQKIRLMCNSPWGQPQWHVGERKGIKLFQSTADSNRATGNYVAFMIIEKIMEEHSGIYQCNFQDYYHTYRAATVNLQIAAPEIQCNDLRTATNRGRFIIHYQNDRRVDSIAQYECADSSDYMLGDNVRKCLSDGKWSGTYPQCTDIRCPLIYDTIRYENDMLITYTNGRKINSDAVFTCKSSTQRLIGTDRRTCLQNGQWSGQDPSCEDITCPEFHRYNSLSITYTDGLKVHSVATFTCDPPAKLAGESSSFCQGDGKWSDPKPSCEMLEIHCPKVEGGDIFTVKYSDNVTRRINSTATLFCKADFKKIEGCNILTCQQNGEWSADFPTCVDYVVCDEFESLPYLNVSYSDGVRVGSQARFRCSDKTTLIGSSYSFCNEEGKWTNPSPTCKAPSCNIDNLRDSLPEGIYPDVSDVTRDDVDSSSELRLRCEDHLPTKQKVLTGGSKAICSHGKWEFGNVQCIPACIPKAGISPHLIIEPREDHYRFGESLTLSCVDGYELTSDIQKLMCLGSSWSDDFPDCIEQSKTSPMELRKVTKKPK